MLLDLAAAATDTATLHWCSRFVILFTQALAARPGVGGEVVGEAGTRAAFLHDVTLAGIIWWLALRFSLPNHEIKSYGSVADPENAALGRALFKCWRLPLVEAACLRAFGGAPAPPLRAWLPFETALGTKTSPETVGRLVLASNTAAVRGGPGGSIDPLSPEPSAFVLLNQIVDVLLADDCRCGEVVGGMPIYEHAGGCPLLSEMLPLLLPMIHRLVQECAVSIGGGCSSRGGMLHDVGTETCVLAAALERALGRAVASTGAALGKPVLPAIMHGIVRLGEATGLQGLIHALLVGSPGFGVKGTLGLLCNQWPPHVAAEIYSAMAPPFTS